MGLAAIVEYLSAQIQLIRKDQSELECQNLLPILTASLASIEQLSAEFTRENEKIDALAKQYNWPASKKKLCELNQMENVIEKLKRHVASLEISIAPYRNSLFPSFAQRIKNYWYNYPSIANILNNIQTSLNQEITKLEASLIKPYWHFTYLPEKEGEYISNEATKDIQEKLKKLNDKNAGAADFRRDTGIETLTIKNELLDAEIDQALNALIQKLNLNDVDSALIKEWIERNSGQKVDLSICDVLFLQQHFSNAPLSIGRTITSKRNWIEKNGNLYCQLDTVTFSLLNLDNHDFMAMRKPDNKLAFQDLTAQQSLDKWNELDEKCQFDDMDLYQPLLRIQCELKLEINKDTHCVVPQIASLLATSYTDQLISPEKQKNILGKTEYFESVSRTKSMSNLRP